MCDSCYDPTGGTCSCNPCLVNQGSNWCTVCDHNGWGPGVPAEAPSGGDWTADDTGSDGGGDGGDEPV